MKKILATTAALMTATTVAAGNIAYVAPEATMIEEPARMGGSGAWIIPLIVLAGIILAVTSSDDEEPPVQPCDGCNPA